MPRWKKDAKEFKVTVNYEEKRGYQSYIPKPIMLMLGSPESLKYTVKGNKIEISSGEAESVPSFLLMKQSKKSKPKTNPTKGNSASEGKNPTER
jgi:hypothetical protein